MASGHDSRTLGARDCRRDGTIENPITATEGMRYFKDKYYIDGGKIYRCTRDDSGGEGTVMHYLPSQLVGIYFEEVRE